MSALRGFIAGTIAVSTVEVVVSAPGVADRIGGAGTFLADVINRVVSPDVPAIGAANFTAPAPEEFAQSTPATSTKPNSKFNYSGGVGSEPYGPPTTTKPRSKVLHSTKAKHPRPTPQPAPTPPRSQ